MTPEQVHAIVREELTRLFVLSDRYYFSKHLQLQDGVNIQFATGTGSKIGTASGQKLGFWGTTPVVQPSAIADVAAGAVASDGVARTAINAILAALRLPGSIAT